MNIYLVISEQLETIVWEDWFSQVGHPETYHIVELVVAESRNQAKYLAWKADDDFSYDMREMPKMSAKIRRKNVEGPSRIVTKDFLSEADHEIWSDNKLTVAQVGANAA